MQPAVMVALGASAQACLWPCAPLCPRCGYGLANWVTAQEAQAAQAHPIRDIPSASCGRQQHPGTSDLVATMTATGLDGDVPAGSAGYVCTALNQVWLFELNHR